MQTQIHAKRYIYLLCCLIVLLPIFIYPAFLFEGIGQPIFIPDGEKVHLVPRLLLIGVVTILGWRFWGTRGLFSGLLIGFAITVVASSLNASDPAGWVFTIFGPKARMDGLLYQLALVALGIAAYGAVRQAPHLLPRVLWALLAAGVLQAVLVVLQRFDLDLVGPAIGGSPFTDYLGSMGSVGIAAGFFLVVVVASLSLLTSKGSSRAQFYLILLGILFVALALGITQNRSALYALLGTVVLFTLIGLSWQRLLIGAGVLLSAFLAPQLLPVKPGIERGLLDTGTLESRLVIWQLGYESLRHIPGSPLLGGGPDAFLLTLTQHFSTERLLDFYRVEHRWPANATIEKIQSLDPPDMGRDRQLRVYFSQFGDRENVRAIYLVRLDKVHNMLFDRLVAFGIFAALIWFLLLAYPVYLVWRQKQLRTSTLWLVLPAIGIYYLAWFPVIQLEPIYMILIAGIWAASTYKSSG